MHFLFRCSPNPTFSKMRPVFYQARFNGSFLLKPPYGRLTQGLLRLLLR